MIEDIRAQIEKLKKARNAVILAHNYMVDEVQDIADFCGDSLELSRKAKENHAETIIFCGVRFMGETAKILCPNARVIMPSADAGCPMADMCQPEALRAFKRGNPQHFIIAYVNTTAETKSLVDLCVTSGNAERIIRNLPQTRPVMFLPDSNLGANINRRLGISMDLWNGFCPTHNRISARDIERAKTEHPGARVIVHLECRPDVVALADAALSTAGMLSDAAQHSAPEYIVGTECGMIHRLELAFPEKKFYGICPQIVCPNMKKITLELVRDALSGGGFEIILPEPLMEQARRPIERMLEMS